MSSRSRCGAAHAVVVSLALLSGLELFAEPEPIREFEATFESGGKAIAVEQFEPTAGGKHPAVIVVHGAGGMQVGGFLYHGFARALARRGYVALVVHYADRTTTKPGEEKPNFRGGDFAAWVKSVADAVSYASVLPNVDASRIGLLGFSLGSYVSLSEAVFDDRVGAVVEFFGGLPGPLSERVKTMPPTLILHGDADRLVAVEEAHKLERLFRENDVTYDIHIYPGAGHGLPGRDMLDATGRTMQFFAKHLK